MQLFWAVASVLAQSAMRATPRRTQQAVPGPQSRIRRFVDRFETESREIFAQRQKIVEAVGPRPGQAVADIGEGTGLFSWMFAEKVGPKGTVYAVEIVPAFLKFIREQARKRGLEKVVKKLSRARKRRRTCLPVRLTWPSSVPPTTISSTRERCWPRSIVRSVRAGGLSSSISISARTAAAASWRACPRTEGGLLPRDRGLGFRGDRREASAGIEGELFRSLQGAANQTPNKVPAVANGLTTKGEGDELLVEAERIAALQVAAGKGGDGRDVEKDAKPSMGRKRGHTETGGHSANRVCHRTERLSRYNSRFAMSPFSRPIPAVRRTAIRS